jgi:topoisomerase-4 subunit A
MTVGERNQIIFLLNSIALARAEGIAVGLSTKVLPHNFNELIDASIKILKGKPRFISDFMTQGIADISNYNNGLRGGRACACKNCTTRQKYFSDYPNSVFNTTTLIDSILKANEKGKKIKKIEDNTAADVEILIHFFQEFPDKTIDAPLLSRPVKHP